MFVEGYQLSDALLWTLVKKFSRRTSIHTTDDLMSEAQAAAAFAIREHKVNKKASLDTFIYECVKNRLIDVTKRHEPVMVYEVPEESYRDENDLHFSLAMKQLLSPDEFLVFRLRFVEDYSEREIAKTLSVSRERVTKCLHRIYHKYTSVEKSHHQISTQRRLADKWLGDSEI